MISQTTKSLYLALLIKSTETKNFSSLGRIVNQSGYKISQKLPEFSYSSLQLVNIAKTFFAKKKKLTLVIDESFLHKFYSQNIAGVGFFFDSKLHKTVKAFKVVYAVLTDGKHTIPIYAEYLFDKKLVDFEISSLTDITREIILWVKKTFHDKEIKVAADGSYSSKDFCEWVVKNNIDIDLRMHSNRTITLSKNSKKKHALTTLKKLQFKGNRKKSKTMLVFWHGIRLYITAHLRIDKNGKETVVFIVSTYKAKPSVHAKQYEKRWNIEKMFRTIKQNLGLKDCQSTNLEKQFDHVMATLLTYAHLQIEMKKYRLESPEKALRQLKLKKTDVLVQHLNAASRIFGGVYA